MGRKIINKESTSIGKFQGHNDDDMYIGENFVAVIDGVSHKSSVTTKEGEIKIAQIITKAIRNIDKPTAPSYAKTLNFDEFVSYINGYISTFLVEHNLPSEIGKMEATGVIYSKYHNQIWLVGDCRAIYDKNIVKKPLKIDEVVIDIRVKIVEALIEMGYQEQELEEDISRKIILKPNLLATYITDEAKKSKIEEYRAERIKRALLECGFSEEEIKQQDLVKKFYNPRDLQAVVKNNPNVKDFGYAIFNGKYTEQKNCKVVQLPENVKTIKLFSDGFSIDALNNDRDLGYAIRKMWRTSRKDSLGIGEGRAAHSSKEYVKGSGKERSTDDKTAIVIEIRNIEKNINEER